MSPESRRSIMAREAEEANQQALSNARSNLVDFIAEDPNNITSSMAMYYIKKIHEAK
jgi:ApbE superfamily uncharacterized protein (UPF0280 family)